MGIVLFKPAKEKRRKKMGRWHFKFHVGERVSSRSPAAGKGNPTDTRAMRIGDDLGQKPKLPPLKWYFRIGVADKSATMELARKAEADAARRARGIINPREERMGGEGRRALTAHRDDYEAALTAQQRSPKHVTATIQYITSAAEGLGWTSLHDVRADRLEAHLAERAEKRKTGARTFNAAAKAWKAFTAWCVRHGRLPSDPLAILQARNEATDRRHRRRDMTDQERDQLILAAHHGPVARWVARGKKCKMLGPDRAMLYAVMLYSGLRLSEAASLNRYSFHLSEADVPVVVLEAAYSKHRRQDVHPLPAVLVKMLRPWLAAKPDDTRPLWVLPYKPVEALLKPDLKRARIPYEIEGAGVVDLHALRHDYITGVAAVAPSFSAAQQAARHRSPEMTARYIHPHLADGHALVDRAFAGKPAPQTEAVRATGTDGPVRPVDAMAAPDPKPPAVPTTSECRRGQAGARLGTSKAAKKPDRGSNEASRKTLEFSGLRLVGHALEGGRSDAPLNRGRRIRTADLLTPSQVDESSKPAEAADLRESSRPQPPAVPTTSGADRTG